MSPLLGLSWAATSTKNSFSSSAPHPARCRLCCQCRAIGGLALKAGSVALQSPSCACSYKLCVASALHPVSFWHEGLLFWTAAVGAGKNVALNRCLSWPSELLPQAPALSAAPSCPHWILQHRDQLISYWLICKNPI